MEPVDWSLMSEESKILRFNKVLEYYREDRSLSKVKPENVVPDTTNRGNTGLSVKLDKVRNIFRQDVKFYRVMNNSFLHRCVSTFGDKGMRLHTHFSKIQMLLVRTRSRNRKIIKRYRRRRSGYRNGTCF